MRPALEVLSDSPELRDVHPRIVVQPIPAGPPLLEVRGLTRDFGTLRANDEVTFSLRAGEVLGIVGENGAGKSTLVKMLAGLLAPTAGEIFLDGSPVCLSSPRYAARLGIGVVHQHFKLVEALTVEQNLALSLPNLPAGRVRYERLRPTFRAIADELGVTLEFDTPISRLSVGGQQQVELVKALLRQPRLLVLDEPTAVLAPSERSALMGIIRRLRERGTATILISHKLEDLFESCDHAVVLRHGRKVGEAPVNESERQSLVRLIIGAELEASRRTPSTPGQRVLTVSDLSIARPNGTIAAQDVSFEVRSGEIVAVCGVEGNGQTELFKAIAGMVAPRHGRIVYELNGKTLQGPCESAELGHLGLAHIAEDRLHDAVVPEFSIADNWLLRKLHDRRYCRGWWLNRRQSVSRTRDAIGRYEIRARDSQARMAELSGGNQQKVVVARELDENPPLVLAGHPTRGLDLRTIAAVRQRLIDARDAGAAILLLSADLDEVWDLADRVMVMTGGRQRGPVAKDKTNVGEIGNWMTSS